MNISVIGSGYVGLVAAGCFAEMGNRVIAVDVDEEKIENLRKGIVPIYEPGLELLLKDNYNKGTILFTTKLKEAITHSEIVFIAVGTPMEEDGSADLKYVLQVAKEIGQLMQKPLIIVNKSTVPIGTADLVRKAIQKELLEKGLDVPFDVVSNPEFLKEGAAIEDFMRPDRVVVGADNEESLRKMKQLYKPFTFNQNRFIGMDILSAEMTKYAANAMLATKISFINEMANICERVGADVNQVRIGIGSDKRIGYQFIYPGCGYGGSCFPKDVNALIHISNNFGYNPKLISSVEAVNQEQKQVLANKIVAELGEDLSAFTIAVWGLSFKPGTDDMREGPAIYLIRELNKRGAHIKAYDPKAIKEAHYYLKGISVDYLDDKYEAITDSDACVLVTEWKEFRSLDFKKVKNLMRGNLFIDGRNQYNREDMEEYGFIYKQIGVK